VFCGIAIIGSMMTHGIELQHQCLHDTAFQSRAANRWIGRLLGIPSLVPYSHYQATHLYHHSFLGTKRDYEFFSHAPLERDLTVLSFFLAAYRMDHLKSFFKNLVQALSSDRPLVPYSNKKINQRIRLEYIIFSIILTTTLGLSLHFGKLYEFFILWLIPLLLIATPLHFIIEFPEHFRCSRSSRDVRENTRSITGSLFSFWLTNGNNLHCEHHLFQHLPIRELPKIHQIIQSELIHYHKTYLSFFKAIIRPSTEITEQSPNFDYQKGSN
jgi:fatty acid desaturase